MKKISFRILIFFIVSVLGNIITIKSFAKNINPSLPLNYSTKELPLLDQALADPKFVVKSKIDDIQAEEIENEILQLNNDKIKGQRKLESIKNVLEDYIILTYYFNNLLLGKINTINSFNSNIKAKFITARNELIRFSKKYFKFEKNKYKAAFGVYHYYTNIYFTSKKNQHRSIVGLKKYMKYFNPYLKRRAKMLVSLLELDSRDNKKQKNAFYSLIRLSKTLPRVSSVVINLTLARKLAGLNSKGRKIFNSTKNYRGYLWRATTKAIKLSSVEKSKVFSYALGIWIKSEKRKGKNFNWLLKAPINFKGFYNLPEYFAVKERRAVDAFNQKKYKKANYIFSFLTRKYEGNILSLSFDRARMIVRNVEYKMTGKSLSYEKLLTLLNAKYSDPLIVGETGTVQVNQMKQLIVSRYESLIKSEIKIAKRKGTNKRQRLKTINLIKRFIKEVQENDLMVEKYQFELAGLYVINKQYKKAVPIYLDLALNSKIGKKKTYLLLAASVQHKVAGFPQKISWKRYDKQNLLERASLFDIYQRLNNDFYHYSNWRILALMGLLQINLGDYEKAFEIWQMGLKVKSNSIYAKTASGYMILFYRSNNRWQSLENLVRECMNKKIMPQYFQHKFKLNELLAAALFNGGKNAIKNNNNSLAVKKLKEFTEKFTNHQSHDEALYLLANAYRATGEHDNALLSLEKLVTNHKHSSFLAKALLNGGNWALGMADEKKVMFFYERYLSQFGNSKIAGKVRSELALLYEGRQHYADAIRMYKGDLIDKNLLQEKVLDAYLKIMDLEYRYGSKVRAAKVADKCLTKIKNLKGNFVEAQRKAFIIKGRYYASIGNMKGMKNIEKNLSNLLDKGGNSAEYLGEIRYYIARKSTNGLLNTEFNNIELKDPLLTINKQYHLFLKVKEAYENVCKVGDSSYCIISLYNLARTSEDEISKLQDIEIADTLDPVIVNKFNDRKNNIIEKLGNLSNEFDEKSLSIVNSGKSLPMFTSQVLWNNSTDWNFDRITGETGNGYIQMNVHFPQER